MGSTLATLKLKLGSCPSPPMAPRLSPGRWPDAGREPRRCSLDLGTGNRMYDNVDDLAYALKDIVGLVGQVRGELP